MNCVTSEVVLKHIQEFLELKQIKQYAIIKIMRFIRQDEILARLKISQKNISVSISKTIEINVDARDFTFTKSGIWIGSGTMMQDVKWK